MFWGAQGNSLIARYINENDFPKTYLARVLAPDESGTAIPGESAGILVGTFIPGEIDEIAVSSDTTRFFSLSHEGDASFGTIREFEKSDTATAVFTLPPAEWIPSWPEKNTLVFTTKPSARAEGFSYTLDIQQKIFKKLLGGVVGLTVLPAPGTAKILYSRGGKNRVDTFIADTKTGEAEKVPIATLSEKCVWGAHAAFLYCAVPERILVGEYPDDWYQGVVTFSDALWSIDTKTNTPQRIAVPLRDAEEEIDATSPLLASDESFLFFINKKDFSLWGLKLKP